MYTTLILDFARVLLFPKKAELSGKLGPFYQEHKNDEGFDFFDYYSLNNELFEYIKKLPNYIRKVIFTAGNIHQDPAIVDLLEMTFIRIFTSEEIGYEKTNPDAYRYILQSIDVKAGETLFIDDSTQNIQAANLAGIRTIQFTSNPQLLTILNTLLK